ncbi:uncharacterized protein B0H18DRAFT_958871 [Fomitopsis serialis]|uniref:uncharacterized protein n=1 Tax=Fomitopsis serialis TaxID=139415 RepID=UPI002007AEC5|nr:uncharacterized protein B0H18DRAFT_958871 [Neoantrodia serialis]KAH9916366.1 hypothetical protein B0H18DRAFT_958871 [Neoantrodia serialis]
MLQSASVISQELHKLRQENVELRQMYQQLRQEFDAFRALVLGREGRLPSGETDTASGPPEASGSGTLQDPEVLPSTSDPEPSASELQDAPVLENDIDMDEEQVAPGAAITLSFATDVQGADIEMDWSAENNIGWEKAESPTRAAGPVRMTPPPTLSMAASPTQSVPAEIPPAVVVEGSGSDGAHLGQDDAAAEAVSQDLGPAVHDASQPPVTPSQEVLPGTTPAEQQSSNEAQEKVVETPGNEPDNEPGIVPQGTSAEPTGQTHDGEHPVSPSVTPNAPGLHGDSDVTAQRTEPPDDNDVVMTSGEHEPGPSNDQGGVATPPMVPSWTTLQDYGGDL